MMMRFLSRSLLLISLIGLISACAIFETNVGVEESSTDDTGTTETTTETDSQDPNLAETSGEMTLNGTPAEICDAATPASDPDSRTYNSPDTVLSEDTDYRAIMCTSAGAIYIDLFEEEAPLTVNSFVFLAESGFYNNTIFHRVIEDFMAQGGDPTGTGRGGPGYQFQDEIVPSLTFDSEGLLAMANAGPGTNGSQFFITYAPTPWLNGRHTIFGEVLQGQDTVDSIQLRDPMVANAPATDLNTVVIITDPSQVD